MLDVDRCDSCKGLLDPVVDVNRWRHRDCPPPPFPPAALAVLERVNRVRKSVVEQVPAGGTEKGCEPDEAEAVEG